MSAPGSNAPGSNMAGSNMAGPNAPGSNAFGSNTGTSQAARDLAASRARMPHTSMFLRMLVRAAVLRRGRAVSALFAMVVAAAVATAMLNLYVDVQAKLQREFRNYGANIVVVGRDGSGRDGASLPAGCPRAGGFRSCRAWDCGAVWIGRGAHQRWTTDCGGGRGF